MIHTHAKPQAQRPVSSKDRVETDRWTDGWTLPIALPSRLTHSVMTVFATVHFSQHNLHSYEWYNRSSFRFKMICWPTLVERGERDGGGIGLRACLVGKCSGCLHCHRSLMRTKSFASSMDRPRHCRRSVIPRTIPLCHCRSRTGHPRGVGSLRRLSRGCAATRRSDCVRDKLDRLRSSRPSETCHTFTVLCWI